MGPTRGIILGVGCPETIENGRFMHLEAFLGRETPFFGDFGGVSERNPPKIAARPGPALGLGPTPAPTPGPYRAAGGCTQTRCMAWAGRDRTHSGGLSLSEHYSGIQWRAAHPEVPAEHHCGPTSTGNSFAIFAGFATPPLGQHVPAVRQHKGHS